MHMKRAVNNLQMKRIINISCKLGLAFSLVLALGSCGPEQSPGVEYMPDMYRSPSIEPYVDYVDYGNPDSMSARQPVAGTVPRGNYRPYPYPNSDSGYAMAGQNLVNPITGTPEVMADGKELYGYFCSHCHGKNGDGKGTIQNAVYGNVPSYADATPNRRGGRAMNQLKAGHIYHTIMYGLNAMGPHASQLKVDERWKIVHYVQSLQGNNDKPPVQDSANVHMEQQLN